MARKTTPYQRHYGKRIQLARTQADLTQEQLGDLVSLTRSSIANIESGRQANTAEQVLLFAHHLGCDPRWLLTGWETNRPLVGRELPAPYEPAPLQPVTSRR